jgi:hypothetical protein
MIIHFLLIIGPYLKSSDTIKIEGWKTYSIACQRERGLLAKALISNKEKIIGPTQKDIESLLGKPNSTDKHYTFYLIENG